MYTEFTCINHRGRLLAPLALVVAAAMAFSSPIGATEDKAKRPSAAPATADGAKSYIVVLDGMPLVAYDGDIKGLAPTKPQKGKKFNANSQAAKKYRSHLAAAQNKVLNNAGIASKQRVHSYTVALNGFSAIMSTAERDRLANTKGVNKVLEDQWRYLDTDSSPTFLGLTGPAGAWQTGLDGEGVIVGVIDSGIWPEHPSFADDGSFPTAPVLDTGRPNCEFGNTAHNPGDVAFSCNNKLIGARQMIDTYRALIGATADEFDSARDDNGHGTHTASTAAGNGGVAASILGIPRGSISGIAPRAHVIAYKGLGDLGGFTSDLASAIDQAVADGVDVINYSIGGGAGTPGGDEIAFLFAADAGVHVATSAGNSGSAAATLGNPGTMPWMTTVAASTQTRFFQGTITLDDGRTYAGASITPGLAAAPLVDAASAGGDLCVPGSLDPVQVGGSVVLCRRGAIARAAKSLAVLQAGGVGMILYENTDDNNLFTDTHWTPAVHVDNTPGLAIKAHIAAASNPTAAFVGGQLSEWESAPSITLFSSRGPNPVTADIIKPDITAPGMQILAGNTPMPVPGNVSGELFQAIAGTSMSSPHVAGALALIKQAHPDWSPAMARSALMTSSYQAVVDNDRSTPAGPFAMGSGHLDLSKKTQKGSAFQPGLAYDADLFGYAALSCGQNWGIFTQGSCDFLESIGVPSDAYNLNYPSIGMSDVPGSRTVQRTVTSVASENGWRTYHVSVDSPPGFEVTVSPASFRLKRGQTATYAVTALNVGAPVGEWRTGSLTWSDTTGHYDVYSPIALRGSLFSAPPLVSGSGESGSGSFDVKFGYTGSYTASAHGLEPATVTSDNVLQDPDQNFSTADGFSKLHTFNLSGAQYFRVAIPPEGTEANADLDVYVFNPGGALAATSTAGGTDELIEITEPLDGTWSVYVHGWSAPGGDSDYDMYSWVISAAPGGNLSIDSAPASATTGSTETIGYSWNGASSGQWHFGAVLHNGDAGVFGTTLVEVDNR